MLLIFGFLFMVFIFAVLGVLTGTGMMFVDLPSALLILVSLLFFLPVSKSGSILGRYFKASLKKDYAYTKAELADLVTAAKHTGKFIMAVGGFGFVTGIAASLMFLENRAMLGPNLAVSLLTLLYAIAISCFVFLPVQAWAENKLNTL
jgi:flagellar motor component MotA